MIETKCVTNQKPHPFYTQLLEHATEIYGDAPEEWCEEQEPSPSTESVCAFLLFKAIEGARDRDSDEMMYWQRAYLEVRTLLKIGFDFDAYFENRKLKSGDDISAT